VAHRYCRARFTQTLSIYTDHLIWLLLLEGLQLDSAKAHLRENALAGQKFGAEADDDAHHG